MWIAHKMLDDETVINLVEFKIEIQLLRKVLIA